jgi:hypothetical protein
MLTIPEQSALRGTRHLTIPKKYTPIVGLAMVLTSVWFLDFRSIQEENFGVDQIRMLA